MEQVQPRPLSIFSPADVGALVEALLRSPSRLRPAVAGMLALASVVLGVLGDVLFYETLPGINILLWHLAVVVALYLGSRTAGVVLAPRQYALVGASLLLTAMIAWRGSPSLHFFNLLGAMFLMLVAVAVPPSVSARRMGFLAFLFTLAVGSMSMATGALRLLIAAPWKEVLGGRASGQVVAAARAVALALPLLVVFGGLFIAADAVFEDLAASVLKPDFEAIAPHVALFIVCGGLAAGVLWARLGYECPAPPEAGMAESRRLRALESGIVLGTLALLFALFVGVQLRYMFGGHDLVESTVDLTYAEYARRGFFELVAASALLLPVLLVLNWARRREDRSTLVFRGLALLLVVLLAIVMASALERLRIYTDTFGLTLPRFYAASFLVWLAAVFAIFLATVLRDRIGEFIWAAVALGVVAIVTLNVLNPEALIARTNTSRLDDGREFDATYVSMLGADAVPVLIDRLDRLQPADQCTIARSLLADWGDHESETRGWNYARQRAADAVEDNHARLQAACPEG